MEYGNFYMTRRIADLMDKNLLFAVDVLFALELYFAGDWGDICMEDKALNDEAASGNGRILAAYPTVAGKIWIITEWDRSATTILFPEEY